jgi:hypothetical protein
VLGGLVFGDTDKLQRLNGIVWPHIGRLAQERAHKVRPFTSHFDTLLGLGRS